MSKETRCACDCRNKKRVTTQPMAVCLLKEWSWSTWCANNTPHTTGKVLSHPALVQFRLTVERTGQLWVLGTEGFLLDGYGPFEQWLGLGIVRLQVPRYTCRHSSAWAENLASKCPTIHVDIQEVSPKERRPLHQSKACWGKVSA